MNKRALEPGDALDGFVIDAVVHAGSMARIFSVHYAEGARDPGRCRFVHGVDPPPRLCERVGRSGALWCGNNYR